MAETLMTAMKKTNPIIEICSLVGLNIRSIGGGIPAL
jgi:hypothetical protein